MWEVNPGPLSNWREMGIPNQGMVAQRRGSETEPFCWLEEMSPPPSYEGVHQEQEVPNTFAMGMWIKSSCLGERVSGLVGLERGAAITGVRV